MKGSQLSGDKKPIRTVAKIPRDPVTNEPACDLTSDEELDGLAAELRDSVEPWVRVDVVREIEGPCLGKTYGLFAPDEKRIEILEPSQMGKFSVLEILAHEVGHAAALLTDDVGWWLDALPCSRMELRYRKDVEETLAFELSFDILHTLEEKPTDRYVAHNGATRLPNYGYGFKKRLHDRRHALLAKGVPIVW